LCSEEAELKCILLSISKDYIVNHLVLIRLREKLNELFVLETPNKLTQNYKLRPRIILSMT